MNPGIHLLSRLAAGRRGGKGRRERGRGKDMAHKNVVTARSLMPRSLARQRFRKGRQP